MTNDAIILSRRTFSALSEPARQELLQLLLGTSLPTAASDPDEEQADDLSVAQARKLLEGCGAKTREALKAMVAQGEDGFTMAAIADALDADLDAGELRGVWGGLTKRIRTVLDDSEAYLIQWEEEADGWRGRLSDMTYRSLSKVIGA